MEHSWIAIITILAFVPWSSANKEVLYQTPNSNWFWEIIPKLHGWSETSSKKAYTACNIADNIPQPNNWLLSRPLIDVGGAQRLDVTVTYTITPCSSFPSVTFCKDSFDIYVWESNISVTADKIPDPITSNSSYRKLATISGPTSAQKHSTVPFQVKGNYIVLGFHDQGGCKLLHSVKVTYNVCPGKMLTDSLVDLPRTLAPSNDLESIPVEGRCTADSVLVQGSLNVLCESSGEWNISRLEGRCICNKEDMENTGGTCTACSDGTYNDGKGLNCTVLPSHPRNVNVSFVNQSSAMITWQSPATTGGQVFYDVDCQKTCSKDCVEETCDGDVSHANKEGLNTTRVTITTLSSFVNYTCKIFAKNRVSEVAARKHLVYANFAIISFKTEGSVPGKPEVFAQQAEGASTLLSWKLNCKNGIIQEYRVLYFRVDDTSDKETLTTKETEIRIEKLEPGKTFEFQVVAVNNFGTGLAGEKTFKIPNGSFSVKSKLFIGAVAGGGALFLIILVIIIIVIIRFRRGSRRNIQKDYMRTIEQGSDLQPMDQRRYIDPENYVDLMELLSTFTSEIERSKTKLEGLIGQGEFADVYKGILHTTKGKQVVAVKVLRPGSNEKNQKDFLSEASIMGQFNHPNVIALIGVVTQSRPMMILTEFLESGSLDNFLKARKSQLTIFQLLGMARGVANGMVYLSEMNFIHRDLAARNILVGENMSCKVSDFGLSRELADDNPDSEYETQGGKIPVRWTAPEALQHRKFSSASDVWSYGILVWEIMSFSDRPYWDWNNYDVISRVETGYRLPPPTGCPKIVHGLILECWESDKNKRPKFAEIVSRLDELFRFPEELNDNLLTAKASSRASDVPEFHSVDEWLKFLSMEKYSELFHAANITSLDNVTKLEDRSLREMGIKLIGHRNKMNKSIKAMQGHFINRGLDEDEAAI